MIFLGYQKINHKYSYHRVCRLIYIRWWFCWLLTDVYFQVSASTLSICIRFAYVWNTDEQWCFHSPQSDLAARRDSLYDLYVIFSWASSQSVLRYQLVVKIATRHDPLQFIHHNIVLLVGSGDHFFHIFLLWNIHDSSIKMTNERHLLLSFWDLIYNYILRLGVHRVLVHGELWHLPEHLSAVHADPFHALPEVLPDIEAVSDRTLSVPNV